MIFTTGAAYWTIAVVLSVSFYSVCTVILQVSPTVVTNTDTAEVILPCEYVLEYPNQESNLRWEKGRDTIFVKDTLGQVFYGRSHKNRVKWGDSCSLILRNPVQDDSGRYTVRVFVPRDRKTMDSGHTMLKVRNTSTKETTNGHHLETSASLPTDPCTATPEDQDTSQDWTQSVPVTIIGAISLTSQVVLVCYIKVTDNKVRLLMKSPMMFYASGLITIIVGMALKNSTALTVGGYIVTVGVIIRACGVHWIMKTTSMELWRNKEQ